VCLSLGLLTLFAIDISLAAVAEKTLINQESTDYSDSILLLANLKEGERL